ncbi:MAG: hypothetical protein IKB93_01480, partial [Clostridia bacterium]|nr:hypothetical protein [Clostridia bacterium]
MKNLNTILKVLAKVLEVFHWVSAGLMGAASVCSVVAPDWLKYFVNFEAKECCGANLKVYGFEVNASVVNGKIDMMAFLIFGIGAVMILALMAMIFHNLHLIFKNSENNTPFQKNNIRKLREIAVYSIAIPIVGFIMSSIVHLVTGVGIEEMSMDTSGIF